MSESSHDIRTHLCKKGWVLYLLDLRFKESIIIHILIILSLCADYFYPATIRKDLLL